MNAPKKISTNPLPIGFQDFKKNPVAGVAFCMLVAVSYLYYDGKTSYLGQILSLQTCYRTRHDPSMRRSRHL